MNNQIKLPFILSLVVLSSVGCSKIFTKKSQKSHVVESVQQVEPKIDTLEMHDVNKLKDVPQDSLMHYVVEIPEEEDSHESIIFSEEQSESIILPEYKNREINDMSFLLTDMNEEFHYPTDSCSYVTSPYGWRHRRMHAGVDLKVMTGDNIYAVFDGVVRVARYYGGYGYCLVIHHYNGLETLYGHSSKLLVGVNDVVKAGDVIALGGNTGRSTGSHLHFEVRIAGNYINPGLVIDTDNHCLQQKNLYITRRRNRIFASNNDSAEEREADIVEELSIKYHIVRSGDVLSRIAVNNHTTVATICRLNNISSTSILRLGQRLIVRDGIRPTTSSTKQVAKPVATPTLKSTTTTVAKSTPAPKRSYDRSATSYTVRSGDTLSVIAQRFGSSVSDLCDLNNISPNSTLSIGQKLRLKGGSPSSVVTASSLSSTSKLTSNATPIPANLNGNIYVVRSGDTLSQIAEKTNTTVREICQLNNITTRTTLQIGQRLKIGM